MTQKQADKLMRVLVVALIFSVMNGTMFNVTLPIIGEEFQLAPSQTSWMMTSYMIVYAIGSVIFGKLADQFRLKDLLTIGFLLFAIGSVIGMLSIQYWMAVLGRITQAAGASILPATAMIIPIRYFAIEQRGRALGTAAVGLALGGAMGPVVAGALSTFGSWRLLFLFSLLSLGTLPFFRKYLDDAKGKKTPIDYLGGGMLASFVALLLLGITQGSWLLCGAGIVTLLCFVLHIQRAKEPFIQPGLFRNKSFVVGLSIAFVGTAMNFSLTFITPQFLADLNALSPGSIGFVLFPAALISAMLGQKGGKLADQHGNVRLVMVASVMMLSCYLLLSSFACLSHYLRYN